jgi:uncharacterized membrane protein YraQ (UPF0718 family)
MVRLCGAALGLLAFAIAIVQGLLVNNPTDVTIFRAVKAMFVFCVIGLCVGYVAHRVLDEHSLRRRSEMFKEVDEDPHAGNGTQDSPGTQSGTERPSQPSPSSQAVTGT